MKRFAIFIFITLMLSFSGCKNNPTTPTTTTSSSTTTPTTTTSSSSTTAPTTTTTSSSTTTSTTTTSVKSGANFVLVSYTKDMTSYNCPVINGTVRNDGNKTGWNVMISWSAYNANNTIIDTASGFPANLGDIPPGVSALFSAVFFNLSNWSQISKLTWTMTWLDRTTGQRMIQVRELIIR